MLFNSHWSQNNEQLVLQIRNQIIAAGLKEGRDVFVDDTNFAPAHERHLRAAASALGAAFEIKSFEDVPLSVCIQRDKGRAKPVGEKVIREMYTRYLHKEPVPPQYDANKRDCIICDIDGTIAINRSGRSHYDNERVIEDDVRHEVLHTVKLVSMGRDLVFVSGRSEASRGATMEWLSKKAKIPPGYFLFMRPNGDSRRDSIVKREIYDAEIAGRWNVMAVFDDRPQVLNECWRPLGLTTFDVGPGIEF